MIYRLLLIITFVASYVSSRAADRTDAEGYPVMYLRGEQIGNGWGDCCDRYMFERSGDMYTLSVDCLDGYFKISGTDWRCNYGGESEGVTVDRTVTVTGVQDGRNFKANSLYNLSISFVLRRDGDRAAPTDISFTVNAGASAVTGLSGTLPVMYINVYKTDADGQYALDETGAKIYNNEIIDRNLGHKEYFKAEYWLDINGCQWMADGGACSIGSPDSPLALEIKARGNYTRTAFAKKPFKIKLSKSQDLLGLTPDKSKHYALLAHADDDKGYLRNFIGFNLGHRIGLPWTPSQQPVELVINGNYRGLYFLTESIRVGDGRIMIDKLADNETAPDAISGGYVVELDNYDETNQIRLTERSCVSGHQLDRLRVTFDTPEVYSDLQRRFVTDQFTAINNAIGANADVTWSYLDLDDAVRYYIVKEVISDVESYHGSTYLYRDRGEGQKWHFSPLWDCGQAFNGSTSDFFYNCDPYGNTWIPSMRQNRAFNDKLRQTWLWFAAQCYPGIIDDIDMYVSHISEAAKADSRRWRGAPTPNGGRQVCDNQDMVGRRSATVKRLEDKVRWLCATLGTPAGDETEPDRDTMPAAPLPDYATGITDVAADCDDNAAPEYYNLSGQRVNAPLSPGVYIVKCGSRVSKVAVTHTPH